MTRAALVAAALLALTGCAAGKMDVPTDPPSAQEVRRIAERAGRPTFYLGASFAGLALTAADAGIAGVTYVYGTCEIPLPADGGCAPPIQVQNFALRARDWRRAIGCYGLPPIRGIPAARHDGLMLFADSGIVKIYARSHAEDVRAARALVPAAGGRLRPAPAAVLRLVSDHCDGAELHAG